MPVHCRTTVPEKRCLSTHLISFFLALPPNQEAREKSSSANRKAETDTLCPWHPASSTPTPGRQRDDLHCHLWSSAKFSDHHGQFGWQGNLVELWSYFPPKAMPALGLHQVTQGFAQLVLGTPSKDESCTPNLGWDAARHWT